MKIANWRTLVALAIVLLITVGFVTNVGIGTLSGFGWVDISILCPLGALTTLLATKTMLPRVLIALAAVVILILLFGKAFCAWACPVPLLQKLRGVFGPSAKAAAAAPGKSASAKNDPTAAELREAPPAASPNAAFAQATDSGEAVQSVSAGTAFAAASAKSSGEAADSGAGSGNIAASKAASPAKALSQEETASLRNSGCATCAEKRGVLDARHFVLGGSVLSAAIFGFPVFCLICPIGLSFASVLLLIRLFGGGELTWSIIIVPLLLVVEVLVFRKWCSKICPLSAFMSLLGILNRSFRPKINDATCIETSKGVACGLCGQVCPEKIDPRHPQRSFSPMNECTKCRECVQVCPTQSLRMPLFSPSAAVRKPGGSDDPDNPPDSDLAEEGKAA